MLTTLVFVYAFFVSHLKSPLIWGGDSHVDIINKNLATFPLRVMNISEKVSLWLISII